MRPLLAFIIRYSHVLVFLLLEAAALALLFRFNYYQQSVYFTSASGVSGRIHAITGSIRQYFHLTEDNDELLARNLYLEQRVAQLQDFLAQVQGDEAQLLAADSLALGEGGQTYRAGVIKNSINRRDNYITLDRGRRHGLRPEMGVVGASGVVGIVYKVSDSYALVISLLNSKSSISCKISRSDYFGYLQWEGGNPRYAYLRDLPRHADFSIGDTVVTSGYSTVFPPGIMVGTIDDISDSNDGLSYLLRVKLSTDFGRLGHVRVIDRPGQAEQQALEQ